LIKISGKLLGEKNILGHIDPEWEYNVQPQQKSAPRKQEAGNEKMGRSRFTQEKFYGMLDERSLRRSQRRVARL
jgi:hypothetical protein